MYEEYLLNNHKDDLMKILEDSDSEKHFAVIINFVKLFEKNTELGNNLLKEAVKTLSNLEVACEKAQVKLLQENGLNVKKSVHIRIAGLPACPELHRIIFPTSDDLGSLLEVSGTVVRISSPKMLEFQRHYMCVRCKFKMSIEADYEQRFVLQAPQHCLNPTCDGKNVIAVKNIEHENCKDYQEIKIQEQVSKLTTGSLPTCMWVTLEDDLVDCCKPGDDITVCGVVMRRWKAQSLNKKLDIELVIRANHVQVNNDQRSIMLVTPEIRAQFKQFWMTHKESPLVGRDIILKSFCPQLFGLYLMKLAVAVTLAGGSRNQNETDTGVRIRSEPHLLLVGDPGTGKSQMLRFASKVIPRSVLTTGIGTTSAGLTVTAVMENGEWQLEAGALVLADEGICCIDEFNSMKEHDRASIHEAMEQQTISVAKASMVCKLSTRCSILAATNPKGHLDPSQPLSLNIALASPLLSRFDLVLMLRDTLDNQWDESVCNHILEQQIVDFDKTNCGPPWTIEFIQAYYIVIKNIHPTLTEDANMILSSYYQAQRQAPSRNVARTTVRLLDSLVRLSQAHARLMFRTNIEIMDAIMAIALIESSMQGAALLLPVNTDILHAQFPDDPTESYIQLLSTVLIQLNLPELLDKEFKSLRKKNSNLDVTVKGNCSKDKAETSKRKSVEKISPKNRKKLNINTDLALIQCIPSVNDIDNLDDSFSQEFESSLIVNSTEIISTDSQEKREKLQKKLCNLRENFQFQTKNKKIPVKTNEIVKKSLNSVVEVNKKETILQQFAFEPSSKQKKNDSQTLFQNDIDDVDLEL